jgi:hypothetical protein
VRGKVWVWEDELDRLSLRGDERLLDEITAEELCRAPPASVTPLPTRPQKSGTSRNRHDDGVAIRIG